MFYTEIQEHIAYAVVGFILYVGLCILLGFISHVLGKNRGFTRTQFWWGFFLGIIGVMWVAIMPTYRVYDEDEKDTFEVAKRREINHYAPALKPRTNENNAKKNMEKADNKKDYSIKSNDDDIKHERINDNKYWGNDINSIIGKQEEDK